MAYNTVIGQPMDRLEGWEKVTGRATYAGDYAVPDLLYGAVVASSIPKGTIRKIASGQALAVDGVVEVITHQNRRKVAWLDLKHADMDAPPGTVFKPLYDDKIWFAGQPIALVVANSYEAARYAASLVHIDYTPEPFSVCLPGNLDKGRDAKKGLATLMKPPPPKPTGDFEAAWAKAPIRASGDFHHGAEHHNPMELFASTVLYEAGDRLTIYDKTQGTINSQFYVANVFGLPLKDVKVLAPFVGGGFGSGLRPQYQLYLAVMAALMLQRSVRVTLDRRQMFSLGHRPQTIQKTRFCSELEGRLTGLQHASFSETSTYEDYGETVASWSHQLYPADHTLFTQQVVPLDLPTPLDMRAPGGSTGMHAIETTLDALSYELGIDPLELRLRNYTLENPAEGKPFTSKELKQCYEKGAAAFGWQHRQPGPRSMQRGNKLVGYGMASGIWDAMHMPVRIRGTLTAGGKLIMENAVTDIGTGSYTVLSQIAADCMGLAPSMVEFRYGNSDYPFSFLQGGSFTTTSAGNAIAANCKALQQKLLQLAAKMPDSPFRKSRQEAVHFTAGKMILAGRPETALSLTEILAASDATAITETSFTLPTKTKGYAKAVHSAAFVEVEVDEMLGTITCTRAVTAVAAGRIINPKTARSQVLGGMVWSLSKALHESTLIDENLGRFINTNLAEYQIPVHADIHDFQVIFAQETDTRINDLGTKGVGEIGVVAMPAALANAIYHATGKRINRFPIHPDDLL